MLRTGKIFGLCQLTIRKALDGQTNVEPAEKIRKVAIMRSSVMTNNMNNK